MNAIATHKPRASMNTKALVQSVVQSNNKRAQPELRFTFACSPAGSYMSDDAVLLAASVYTSALLRAAD
jgi:hypothetical protein